MRGASAWLLSMIRVLFCRPCCVYKDTLCAGFLSWSCCFYSELQYQTRPMHRVALFFMLSPVDPMAPLISLGLPLLRLSAPRLVKYRPSIAAHAWQQSRSHRLSHQLAGDELYEKTTVTRIERDSAEMMLIESYSSIGFIINGDQVVGPCAQPSCPGASCSGTTMESMVASYKDVSLESLSLFHLLVPKIEILVLGTGDRVQRLDPAISRFMRQKGVALEVQDTVSNKKVVKIMGMLRKRITRL
ncbi:unnamed protein product [Ranitomeya imitator]|uniref:NADH dehydrogenase [ubiquinone] 1 alpha subcomplex assembly factor 3 n=1 Tax=Ranitomeya imitator TaxID=111125 RepID=A0ABN9MCY8_9NEOB|nr:unnamed protein product [Ranitomeya imitator]